MRKGTIENSAKFAFITLGVMALNSALMANGVETMPGMWIKEVYENSMLGASIGAITGLGLGGAVAASVVSAQDGACAGYVASKKLVGNCIKSLRDKFLPSSTHLPKNSI